MTLRVLLVEDEAMIALEMEDQLAELGCEVATAMRLEPALALAAQQDFDVAILDVNLDGVLSYPLADWLAAKGVPYCFATGYGSAGVLSAYADRPAIRKPIALGDLRRTLEALAGGAGLVGRA
jgi:DNA-binding response OmpR family regulator